MTIFELVKLALDGLYAEASEKYGAKVDAEVAGKIKYLSESYGQLSDQKRDPVDYRDPATRFAYVYKYVTSHADYIVQVLEDVSNKLKGKVFSSEAVRISCIGGGPGSDIIALLKYLDENKSSENVKKVVCYLLDREQAWADTWTELDESLDSTIKLNTNFQPFDVTDQSSWSLQKKFLNADLFTMSFFVSEVISLDATGKVTAFWKALFDGASSGAKFLYIDNGHSVFSDYFDKIWSDAGMKCLIREDGVSYTPRYSEQKSGLDEYLTKFGQQPKMKGNVSVRVLIKP